MQYFWFAFPCYNTGNVVINHFIDYYLREKICQTDIILKLFDISPINNDIVMT
jgi:hypothetical protein